MWFCKKKRKKIFKSDVISILEPMKHMIHTVFYSNRLSCVKGGRMSHKFPLVVVFFNFQVSYLKK